MIQVTKVVCNNMNITQIELAFVYFLLKPLHWFNTMFTKLYARVLNWLHVDRDDYGYAETADYFTFGFTFNAYEIRFVVYYPLVRIENCRTGKYYYEF
jgi:hypothetical protein